jgi:small subunit ribosomal protein S16
MLKIRLARHGRKKRPFYRIVLTEHTKPTHAGYQKIFGRFDPLAHTMQVDVEAVKSWIEKGAKPSERVAKLLYKDTNDKFFSKYYEERERVREVRNPSEAELAAREAAKNPPKVEKAVVKVEEAVEEKVEEIVKETPAAE